MSDYMFHSGYRQGRLDAQNELEALREQLREANEVLQCEHETGCIGAYEGREFQCDCLFKSAREYCKKWGIE